jgi:ribosomal protein S6--L-glutamate ligase
MKIALITTLPSLIENARLKQEAEKMGHSLKVVDLKDFNFSIKKSALDVINITGIKVNLVIIRGIFVSIKTIAAVIQDLRQDGVKVFDNQFLKNRYSIDKVTDLVKLSQAGLPVPASGYTRDFKDYPRLVKQLGYPLIVKSTRMGKGVSVFKIDTEKDFLGFVDQCQEEGKVAKNFLLQKFIDYEIDLRILIIGQKIFTMRRIPATGEFRANFSLGGRVEGYDLDEKGRKLALRALKAIGLSVGGVDMLITKDDQRFFLEVNHTAGFVGMEKATGQNIAQVWLKHAIDNAK